jgi:hypothetical protein
LFPKITPNRKKKESWSTLLLSVLIDGAQPKAVWDLHRLSVEPIMLVGRKPTQLGELPIKGSAHVAVAGKGMREFPSKLGVGGPWKTSVEPCRSSERGGGEKPTRQPEQPE